MTKYGASLSQFPEPHISSYFLHIFIIFLHIDMFHVFSSPTPPNSYFANFPLYIGPGTQKKSELSHLWI